MEKEKEKPISYRDCIEGVLEAFEKLLNDSFALDYCGITGKDRTLILNDPVYIQKSRQIRAKKYAREIEEINSIANDLNVSSINDDGNRIGDDTDNVKILNLKMKAATMRREMLSLSGNEKEADEVDSLNIFFIGLTREEFEHLQNVEIHEGEAVSQFGGEDSKAPEVAKVITRGKAEREALSVPKELSAHMISYTNEHGEKVLEEA